MKLFFDSFFILLNISNPYTIIPCLLFTRHTGINSAIICFLTILYIVCRFKKRVKIHFDSLFAIYILLFSTNMLNALFQKNFAIGFLSIFLSSIVFYILLYNIYIDYKQTFSFEKTIRLLTRGYAWLCFYQIFIVAILLLCTEGFHLFNPLINEISYDYDLFLNNVSRVHSGVKYYFPYHLSLFVWADTERLPFFHSYGIIAGVFHEPHTMTYYILPFFFLVKAFKRKKLINFFIDSLFVIYMLVAASTTNILCFLSALILWISIRYRKLVIIIIPIVIQGFLLLQFIENPILDLILFKLDSGSAEYSSSTLSFAFTPQTLWGHNFLDLSYLETIGLVQDVGWLIFIMNIVFLLVYGYKTLKLCFSTNRLLKFVGFFSLYFMLHSSKLALRTYSLEILIFMIFIVTICYKNRALIKYEANG